MNAPICGGIKFMRKINENYNRFSNSRINLKQIRTIRVNSLIGFADPMAALAISRKPGFPLYDEFNNCIAVGLLARDVTGLKQWESSLKNAVSTKEEMLQQEQTYWDNNRHLLNVHFSELSHALQQMSAQTLAPSQRSEIYRIHDQIEQMNRLFNDMHAYMSIDSDETVASTTTFNLLEAIDGLQDFFSSTFALQCQRFVVNVDSKLDFQFIGDIDALKQSLRALVLFMLQHQKAKVIFLQAQSLERTGNSLMCQFSVSCIGDYVEQHGRGHLAPRNEREILDASQTFHYNPYYRLASAVLKKLGGTLQVQQNDQHGLQLTTKLEFVFQSTQFQSGTTLAPAQDNILYYGRKTTNRPVAHVLIVEDNVINQHVVSLILKEIGCTSDIANNATEALALWDKEYDFVFLDIGLPGMDGFELAHELRLNKNKKHVPIIGMSAHICVTEHDRDSLGPLDDFINKPFGLANVNSLIKKWVIDREESRAVAQEL
jgi:two-component system aerobic respiration control sensor histidine kinase ArcB